MSFLVSMYELCQADFFAALGWSIAEASISLEVFALFSSNWPRAAFKGYLA